MKKPSVLVSGGAGYIGSHTAVELIAAGYDVVIVDNLSNSDIAAVEGVRRITGAEIPFVEVDCCDRTALRRVFETYDFDSVIHFAASKAVGESVQKPLEYYTNNLTSFMNIIALMREFGRHNIVFSSSCTVYGEPDKQPVTEQTPRKPATSPYGNTKQMCEDILRDSIAAYEGLKGIALRYFNPIGAHPSAQIGELPRGVPQNLVPYITQTAAGVRECLSVFGRYFAVFPSTTIANWLRTYRKFGYNGLKPKPKGRQPTMGRKRIHPLTPEQQELADLKQENYQLKMKVAILEKLKALVDQRTEKNKRQ